MMKEDMESTKIEISKLVSYAQYQSQFKKVFEKYKKLLEDKTFDTAALPEKQKKIMNTLIKNFSE